MPLSVNVEASETFPANEAVTLPKLRKAAKPSVAISGTVGAIDLASNSISTAKLENGCVTADKMGNAAIDGDSDNTNKRGVLLVSGVQSGTTTGQFEELYAGEVNQFLIGSGTVSEGVWAGDYNLKSKALGSGSSLEVTSQNNTSFDLVIKDGAIVQDMMGTGSVGKAQIRDNNITLSKITAGGGIAADGGIAENDATFWGGIIQINPALTVGGYHGKVVTLQPSKRNQILYADEIGKSLIFGDHPQVPRASITAWQTSGTYSTDTADAAATTTFKLIRANNVTSIERTAKGTYKVKFPSDVYATGDVVYVSGKAIDDDDHTFTPIAGVLNDANGVTNNTVTTTNDVQEVIVSIYSKFGQNVAQSTLHNGSYIELAFY